MKSSNVAVIMCVYRSDSPEFVSLAINSILSQSYKCDLLIYRDGLVTSDLEGLLKDLRGINNFIYFESDENKGLAYGLNCLIDYALNEGYEYIARMDGDDISLPDRIGKQVDFMNSNLCVDVLGTACREFGSTYALEKKVLPAKHAELINFSITRCPFIHPSVVFRSRVFSLGVRYPTVTTLTEDMALWFELLTQKATFANLDEVLLDYRLNESTLYRRKGFAKALSEVKVRFKYMIKLKKISVRNVVLILFRLVFHMLPVVIVKLAYRKLR